MACNGVPFNQADSASLRVLLGVAGAEADDLPKRRHVRLAIDVVYDAVIAELHADLRKASAFSLVFDGWTARGLRNAYIAILYSFLDEKLQVKLHFFLLSSGLTVPVVCTRVSRCGVSWRSKT